MRSSYAASCGPGPRHTLVRDGPIDAVEPSRQTSLEFELGDPRPGRRKEEQPDREPASEGREPVKDGPEHSGHQCQHPEACDQEPAKDPCAIEREILRQDATQLVPWNRGC